MPKKKARIRRERHNVWSMPSEHKEDHGHYSIHDTPQRDHSNKEMRGVGWRRGAKCPWSNETSQLPSPRPYGHVGWLVVTALTDTWKPSALLARADLEENSRWWGWDSEEGCKPIVLPFYIKTGEPRKQKMVRHVADSDKKEVFTESTPKAEPKEPFRIPGPLSIINGELLEKSMYSLPTWESCVCEMSADVFMKTACNPVKSSSSSRSKMPIHKCECFAHEQWEWAV